MTSYKATDVYSTVRELASEAFASTNDPQEVTQKLSSILNENIPTYTWVGVYLVEGDDLVLAGWQGPAPTEHTRIPIGQGICGYAAAHAESIIVADVSQDPRYLQCFLDTRSEIVVPVIHDGEVLGEIDVDGSELNAFGAADQELLEELASKLGSVLASNN